MFRGHGIYSISNSNVPIVLDLNTGSPTDGTPVTAWEKLSFATVQSLRQLWLIEPTKDADTFTIRNLQGGTYLDLTGGLVENGTPVIGYQRTYDNQLWIIRKSSDSYRIQNKMTGTFLDLYNGGGKNGTKISGWAGNWNKINIHQLWSFEALSFTGKELLSIIGANPHLSPNFKPYRLDRLYWIVDQGLLKIIWDNADLGSGKKYQWRAEIFDCDDFAIAYKADVAKWGSDNIRADGLSLLCGVMLGLSTKPGGGAHAYNFMLSSDYSNVEFFEPQNGEFMTDIGYDAFVAFF